jgi:hypothetical protein
LPKANVWLEGTGVGGIMRDIPKQLKFDRINDALE